MSAERQPTYSPEEFARRGNEIYERDIAPRIPVADKGKIVAIDFDSGAFVVAEDTMRASEELLEQYRTLRSGLCGSATRLFTVSVLASQKNQLDHRKCYC